MFPLHLCLNSRSSTTLPVILGSDGGRACSELLSRWSLQLDLSNNALKSALASVRVSTCLYQLHDVLHEEAIFRGDDGQRRR
jgi:hypothetical protein